MNDDIDASIPTALQPAPGEFDFDLDQHLASVVSIRADIPDDAFTAAILGTERHGHGAVINDQGLIATIGYLVTEAERIWIQTANGDMLAGDLVGYDYESGFGLVQALGKLGVNPLQMGDVRELRVGDRAIVAGHGGRTQAVGVEVIAKQEFVGYWEYIVDEAIYTSPPHPNWGGAALLGPDGKLYGVGSLYAQQIRGSGEHDDGNMIVPIQLLVDILDEMLRYGQTMKPPRPWLGMFATETENGLIVAGLYEQAPAAMANIQAGDRIVKLAGQPVDSLSELFRQVWAMGEAGTVVPLTIMREGSLVDVAIASVDRRQHWKTPQLH